MKITNSNFYLITITALAALIILGLYFFSRKHDCCGDCHVHGATATEQVEVAQETPAAEQTNEVPQTAESVQQ